MQDTLFTLGNYSFSTQLVVIACLSFGILILLYSGARTRKKLRTVTRNGYQLEGGEDGELDAKLEKVLESQSEITGRMQTMAEIFGSRQSDLMRAVNDRLDGMGKTLGASVLETHRQTHHSLRGLHERMALLDQAQKTMGDLAGQVTSLQKVLSDKQARGAFGQRRMEQIIEDSLASSSYSFQGRLSNNTRPDCIIHMPSGAPPLVIDAKFPLEGYEAVRSAKNREEFKAAATRFKRDISKHLDDISSKYLLVGETQETALMFVPSESVFAEINENFVDLVQKAYRLRVVIVSPSLLMLSVQVVQSVLRDARMREQAHVIQAEVSKLLLDVSRLAERVEKLHTHFSQTAKDIDQIIVSGDKIQKRGQKIEELELGSSSPELVISKDPSHPGFRETLNAAEHRVLEEDELPSPFHFS
ncbi:DNA recombination protein RmuC [Flexibacterium corallicola]|uniref:DNA recombination protein RmuC n=1 Tax=Flexibacterium corallicola TaxID=3037259 RepID=UPI00286F6ACA|nr:DNA recombination protein RmuC [Pseudovibrio sp. M1P-2-3]